jgi:hypothetical protein
MRRAKREFEKLYEEVSNAEDPAFNILEYFMEESREEDLLARSDEFVEDNIRPYIGISELEKELDLTQEEMEQGLDELTGMNEVRGYLRSNDYRRKSQFHRDYDRWARMTDRDVRKKTAQNQRISDESPDELSFKLGGKIEELEEFIEVLEENPEAGEAYRFITDNQSKESTEHSYPGKRGVPTTDLEEQMEEEVMESLSPMMTSLGDGTSEIYTNKISPKAIYDRVEGGPENNILREGLAKLGLASRYSEEELEPFKGKGSKLYRTRTHDFQDDRDPFKYRLADKVTS